MDTSLMEEVEEYLDTSFSPEFAGELRASLMLFEAFGLQKPYEDFPDILYDIDAENRDLTQQKFLQCFHAHLDSIFTAHQITLVEDVDFMVKNQILAVLYRLQHLEDPTPTLRILESSFSGEEQLAKIIGEFSILDETQVLMAIDAVDDTTLDILRTHLYKQEEEQEQLEKETTDNQEARAQLLQNLRDFFAIHGKDNLGYEMLQNGVQAGWASSLYYPYVKEMLIHEDDKQTAKNLLSFFFIASDTYNDPVKVYRTVSEHLLTGMERITRIEVRISELLSELRQYQKAQNDARQVSVVQHSA